MARAVRFVLLLVSASFMLCATAGAAGLAEELPVATPRPADDRLAQQMSVNAGRPLVINFWASWCEPCRDEMPALGRLPKRLASSGLSVLTVAVADSESDAKKFMREAQLSLPVLHDRDQRISRAWGARLLPYTVVLDRRHRIVARAQGEIDWDDAAVIEQLRRLVE